MEMIHVPRLRMNELQTLSESSLSITGAIPEVANERQKVETELTAFKEGMLKSQASAEGKRTIDKERDRYVSGLAYNIKAERFYPYTEEESINTVNELLKQNSKYGIKSSRLPVNEQTATVDNWIDELEALDLSKLNNTAISRWVELLKDANQRFKEVAGEFIEENAEAGTLESASSVAPELTNALEQLYIQLFALIRVSPSDTLTKAYSELEILIDSYR